MMDCSPLVSDMANMANDSRAKAHHHWVSPKLNMLSSGESITVSKAPPTPRTNAHHLTDAAIIFTLFPAGG